MFYKILLLLFTINNLQAESKLKKSIHYYAGMAHFFMQKTTSEFVQENKYDISADKKELKEEKKELKESKKKDSDVHSPQLQDMNLKGYPIESLYFIYSEENSKETLPNYHKDYCKKMETQPILTHGFLLSIYLAEIEDIAAFGICIGGHNISEHCIEFNPKTGTPSNAPLNRSNRYMQNEQDKDDNDDDDKYNKGNLYFKRNIPLSAGIFFQLQNDDIDFYSAAIKLNGLIGLLRTHLVTKSPNNIIDKNVITDREIFIHQTVAITVSAQVIMKIMDIEISIIIGVNWAPNGINMETYQNSKIQTSKETCTESTKKFKTNHLQLFAGLSFGFSFE